MGDRRDEGGKRKGWKGKRGKGGKRKEGMRGNRGRGKLPVVTFRIETFGYFRELGYMPKIYPDPVDVSGAGQN